MKESQLPKGFFQKNKLDNMSAAKLLHASMDGEMQEVMETGMDKTAFRDEIQREKEAIANLSSAEEVIRFMRGKFSMVNQALLTQKALSMQDEVMPLLLRRYRTNMQDTFLETAMIITSEADQKYIDQVKTMYPEIQDVYAKSLACLLFGYRKQEDMLPLLLSEYERMKKDYPQENLCQAPLLGIYILFDKT
jgi:hypothetical protein